MAAGFLLSLAPAADAIFTSIKNVLGKDKKAAQLVTEVSKQFTDLYTASLKDLQKGVALISGWKPIVARIQALEATVHSWETVLDLARVVDDAGLAMKVISSARVKNFSAEVSGVQKALQDVAKNASMPWNEGGADVEGELRRLQNDADLLLKVVTQFEEMLSKMQPIDEMSLFVADQTLANIRGRMVTVVTYYDFFLRGLATDAAAAPQHFLKGIETPVKQAIKSEFDSTSWADILTSVYKAINK